MLGASSHRPEDLDYELSWIDDQVDSKPYGVDIVCTEKFDGRGMNLTLNQLEAMVPGVHKDYVATPLAENGITTISAIRRSPVRSMLATRSERNCSTWPSVTRSNSSQCARGAAGLHDPPRQCRGCAGRLIARGLGLSK
ncbi:MAG: hypothetical protein QOH07_3757 [Mycobacterium sp.]|nr:hypothetical protein [Mycobacterium sp.]